MNFWHRKRKYPDTPAYYYNSRYIIWAEDVQDRRNPLPDRVIGFDWFGFSEQMLTWIVDIDGELRSIPCK